jgi:uncharacterized Tic20 family protein
VDTPFAPYVAGANREAQRAYMLCLLGLVPLLGLVIGPLCVFWALRIQRKTRDDADFTFHGPIRATVVLGLLCGLTNWVGLGLIVLGLLS